VVLRTYSRRYVQGGETKALSSSDRGSDRNLQTQKVGMAAAGEQPGLEKQLNVNDFPNVIVVNPHKHISVKMLSGFHKR